MRNKKKSGKRQKPRKISKPTLRAVRGEDSLTIYCGNVVVSETTVSLLVPNIQDEELENEVAIRVPSTKRAPGHDDLDEELSALESEYLSEKV